MICNSSKPLILLCMSILDTQHMESIPWHSLSILIPSIPTLFSNWLITTCQLRWHNSKCTISLPFNSQVVCLDFHPLRWSLLKSPRSVCRVTLKASEPCLIISSINPSPFHFHQAVKLKRWATRTEYSQLPRSTQPQPLIMMHPGQLAYISLIT